MHSPVEDDCLSCHQTEATEHPRAGEKEFTLTDDVPALCYECHDALNDKTHVHSPVEEGDCLSCHNPHSSENEFLLTAESGAVCLNCHDLTEQGYSMHGPVAANMCMACHDPHQTELAGILLREDLDLCLFCHVNKKDLQNKPSVHEPFTEGCLSCHSPHSSPYQYMVNEEVPALCFECHEEVEVKLDKQSSIHGPFQKGGKCYLCHNAHVSDYEHLLQNKEEKLCFKCHDKKIKMNGLVIKNIAGRVNGAKYIHTPIKEDGCSACHEAHSPDNYFLLSAAFPKGAYSEGKTESFAHCFDCHDEALMKEAQTTEATAFRDGTRNLHYVHVNRKKARSCTVCHDVHGAKYAHLIAAKVPFGKWEMPMKYENTSSGGSCLTGRHKKLAYSRTNKQETTQ